MAHLHHEASYYDLHRLITFLIFAGAFASAICVTLAVYANFQAIGIAVLNTRADFLGDYTQSPLAYVFNIGLLMAGLCVLLAMVGLYLLMLNKLTQYIAIAGGCLGLSIVLMGVFPVNFLDTHRIVSTIYLFSSLTLHGLILFTRRPNHSFFPHRTRYLSLLCLICSAVLASQLNWTTLDFPPCDPNGPICLVATTMWLLTNLTILWCLTLAVAMRRLARIQFTQESLRQLEGKD